MNEPTLKIIFFKSDAGTEPVREWLRGLTASERKAIGEDIKTVQYGWPLGMPLVRKMKKDLWEVRVTLENKIARILFTVEEQQMMLLHGFVKKSPATPATDLQTAMNRLKKLRSEL
ncbi:MAG: type II toxin-antitoxin system RelE/ParE family toxin [Burkholderiales bacterium]